MSVCVCVQTVFFFCGFIDLFNLLVYLNMKIFYVDTFMLKIMLQANHLISLLEPPAEYTNYSFPSIRSHVCVCVCV